MNRAQKSVQNRLELDTSDKNQLVFPLYGDVLLPYSDKILEGRKTVELRHRFPVSISKGTAAYIYSTSPVRALVGKFKL